MDKNIDMRPVVLSYFCNADAGRKFESYAATRNNAIVLRLQWKLQLQLNCNFSQELPRFNSDIKPLSVCNEPRYGIFRHFAAIYKMFRLTSAVCHSANKHHLDTNNW